jgi:EAL domain-containing protein (putative c-di-GMP-specific phosphodiesterase class I)
MMVRAIATRSGALALAAIVSLAAVCVLRFVFDDPAGVILLAVVPITVLGMLYGVRGGLAAALVAVGTFVAWDLTGGDPEGLEYVDRPLIFFGLGLLSGYYARDALGDHHPRRVVSRAELRAAVREGELQVHYQPLAEARTRRVVAIEALARWRHPTRGLLAPAEFIPLAEGDRRTMWELTLHVIESAVAERQRLPEGLSDLDVHVNVSAVSLRRDEVAGTLAAILQRQGCPPERVAVELTESALVEDPRPAIEELERIRGVGARVALDDFGTGYSSLSRLGSLAIDMIKIDRRLIGETPGSPAKLVPPVIGLADALDLRVVAEGVEEWESWDRLAELGCDAIQGFCLSRPLPADELRSWLRGQASSE